MADITISTNSKTLNEVAGNNGAIANTITFKAAGGTFAGDNGDALGIITGVPEGLTAVLVKTSATTAKLVLKGTAAAHNDLANAAANGTTDDTPAATRAGADAVDGKAVNTITLSGKYEEGDKITVSGINNETVYTVEADDVKADAAATLTAIATKLAAQINDFTLLTVTAAATEGVVTLTTKENAASLDASVVVTNANADNANGLTVTFASDDFATGDFPAAGLVVDYIDFKFVDPAEAGTLTLVPPAGADTTGVYSAGSKTNTFENLPTISGTGKADDKIYIYSNGGTKPLNATQPVTVDKDGKWELDLSGLKFKDGAHVVTASTSSDGKGAMSAPFAFTVDSKAPSAPSVTAIKGAISDVTPVLTGKAEKFATVKVYSSDTQVDPTLDEFGKVTNSDKVTLLGVTKADAKGVWTLQVEDPALLGAADTTYKISALAIDAAGNSTKSKKTVDLTIDTKIDTPTLVATAPKKNTVALSGKLEGETGGTVQLYGGADGSVPLGKVAKINKNGEWKMTLKLSEGEHLLSVVATDAAGNVSANSVIDDKTTVTIDTFTATPTLELDKSGETVVGVKGTAEPGAKVKITIGKKTLETTAKADGTWSQSFDGFTPDSTTKAQTIKAVATDTVGNVSKPSVAVTHTFTEAAGGGDAFTVTEGGAAGGTGTVTFSNAVGAVTLTINNDGNLVFTDTTPTAKTSTYKVADMAAGGIPAVTMSAATFANLADKLADNSATLGAVTTNVDDVITNIGKIKADGIESITLTAAQTTAANLGNAALKAGSVTVTEALTGQAATDALANLTKFKADGIESITLSAAQTTAANLGNAALKAGSVTVTEALADQAATDALGALAKFKAEGIESITLSNTQFLGADGNKIALNNALLDGALTVNGADTGVTIDASGYTKGLKLNGGDGDDTITGGAGADEMTGGEGVNTFIFAGGNAEVETYDTITDLVLGIGGDVLQLGGITPISAGNIKTLGVSAQNNVTAADSLTDAVELVANSTGDKSATTFTYGEEKFIFYNVDDDGAFTAGTDMLIKITGVTGTWDASNITTA